jgi:catechol 2,3-dioxygenase-like lactoylglutathione lyase family enzyme
VITALDHVAVAVRDFEAAVEDWRRLLGREPELEPRDGADRAWFHLANTALEIIAASGDGAAGERVRARLDEAGEGVWILAFQVEDLDTDARLAERRGLAVERAGTVARTEAGGVGIVLTPGRIGAARSPAIGAEAAAVPALDHVVIRTANIDRAVANFGGRLGLDLRLDRANPGWGARQLFFKCGDTVVEFGASLKARVSDAPDSFGGLAWRTAEPDAVHARLAAAGFNVSEVRSGRKPGTKVFTVRDAPAGVPTIVLSAEPLDSKSLAEPA